MQVTDGRQDEHVETSGLSVTIISPGSISRAAYMPSPRDADTHRTANTAALVAASCLLPLFRLLRFRSGATADRDMRVRERSPNAMNPP